MLLLLKLRRRLERVLLVMVLFQKLFHKGLVLLLIFFMVTASFNMQKAFDVPPAKNNEGVSAIPQIDVPLAGVKVQVASDNVTYVEGKRASDYREILELLSAEKVANTIPIVDTCRLDNRGILKTTDREPQSLDRFVAFGSQKKNSCTFEKKIDLCFACSSSEACICPAETTISEGS